MFHPFGHDGSDAIEVKGHHIGLLQCAEAEPFQNRMKDVLKHSMIDIFKSKTSGMFQGDGKYFPVFLDVGQIGNEVFF